MSIEHHPAIENNIDNKLNKKRVSNEVPLVSKERFSLNEHYLEFFPKKKSNPSSEVPVPQNSEEEKVIDENKPEKKSDTSEPETLILDFF